MKKLSLSLAYLAVSFLYSMNESIEITLANNQKALLTKAELKRLMQSSTMLKNAAQDFHDEEYLPTYFPFIEDSTAISRISNLLNNDGMPNEALCAVQTKGDWCTIAPALAALDIECLNPYLLDTLEKTYSSPPFCHTMLRNDSLHSFSYETLPPTLKNELASRINQKNVAGLTKYSAKTLSALHNNWVTAIVITHDSKMLVSGSFDHTIKLWDLQSDSHFQTLQGHQDHIRALAITPDVQTLISGSDDKTIKFWNLSTGTLRKTLHLKNHENRVSAVAISPNGQTVVSASGGLIKLWNLQQSSSLYKTFQGHEDLITTLAISADDQTIVSGSLDRTIKLWNFSTSSLQQTLQGHDSFVTALAITPDSQTLVSGSADKTIKIWNLPAGSLRQTLQAHNDWVDALAISTDGKTLVSASLDDTIKLWKLNLSSELKNYLLQRPLEKALVIQALRTRSNLQESLELTGKPYEHFKQLHPEAQNFLCKELNLRTSPYGLLESLKRWIGKKFN